MDSTDQGSLKMMEKCPGGLETPVQHFLSMNTHAVRSPSPAPASTRVRECGRTSHHDYVKEQLEKAREEAQLRDRVQAEYQILMFWCENQSFHDPDLNGLKDVREITVSRIAGFLHLGAAGVQLRKLICDMMERELTKLEPLEVNGVIMDQAYWEQQLKG